MENENESQSIFLSHTEPEISQLSTKKEITKQVHKKEVISPTLKSKTTKLSKRKASEFDTDESYINSCKKLKFETNNIPILVNHNESLNVYHKQIFLRQKLGNCVVEIERNKYLGKLLKIFTKECQKYFGWSEIPNDSFVRWTSEGYIHDNIDPLLPSNRRFAAINTLWDMEESSVISQEIKEDFPAKIMPKYPRSLSDIKSHLSKYINAFDISLEKYESNSSNESHLRHVYSSFIIKELELQRGELKELELELNQFNSSPDFYEVKEKYSNLRNSIHQNLEKLLGPFASFISKKIQFTSLQFARKIIELSEAFITQSNNINNSDHLSDNNNNNLNNNKNNNNKTDNKADNNTVDDQTLFLREMNIKNYSTVYSKEITGKITNNQLMELTLSLREKSLPSHLLSFKFEDSDLVVTLPKKEYDSLFVSFNSFYDDYLQIENSLVDNESKDQFAKHKLWVLARRYKDTSLQASVPPKVMELLKLRFDVEFECFASPFNNYFPNYTSAFADSDCIFGSLGSFFQFKPIQGSFQAAPPVCEILYVHTAKHIIKLLKNTLLPLSFIVFMIDWKDAKGYQKFIKSGYTRSIRVANARDHHFVKQRCVDTVDTSFRALSNMAILCIQNEAAFAISENTIDDHMDEILDEFAPQTASIAQKNISNYNNNNYDNYKNNNFWRRK